MEILFAVVKYLVFGFVALIALAIVFGKRIEKKWDFEAKFRDARGREVGEFEVELSRIPKDETEFTLDAEFDLAHPALQVGRRVQVELEGERVMEGTVQREGRIRLDTSHLCAEIKSPAAGDTVTVQCDGEELFSAELYAD